MQLFLDSNVLDATLPHASNETVIHFGLPNTPMTIRLDASTYQTSLRSATGTDSAQVGLPHCAVWKHSTSVRKSKSLDYGSTHLIAKLIGSSCNQWTTAPACEPSTA